MKNLQTIIDENTNEIRLFQIEGVSLSPKVISDLYDFYVNTNQMPMALLRQEQATLNNGFMTIYLLS
jgi:hypothetical protein